MTGWTTRAERAGDEAAVRAVNAAAFGRDDESDLVDALRTDPAWIPELAILTLSPDGRPVGYTLMTRCHVGETPALCLGPCAVVPDSQRAGAGTAGITTVLAVARELGERWVVVLGHPTYYPRFGFERASAHGIRLSIDVSDEVLMVLSLDGSPIPSGVVSYATPFGI